jgi:hypothetical protein
MSTLTGFTLAPSRRRFFFYSLVTAYFTACCAMTIAGYTSAPGAQTGIAFLVLAGTILLAVIGFFLTRDLALTGRVFERRRLPTSLWRNWRNATLGELTLMAAFIGVLIAILLTSPLTPAGLAGGLAMLSIGLSLGVLAAVASASALPPLLRWVLIIGAALLQMTLMVKGPTATLTSFSSLPLAISVALTLAWPAMATMLLAHWQSQVPDVIPPLQAVAKDSIRAAVKRHLHRYVNVDWFANRPVSGNTATSGPGGVALSMVIGYNLFLRVTPMTWSEGPSVGQLGALVVLALMMTNMFVARDLHWRSLLAPGGLRQGHIASALFGHTLLAHTLGIVALGFIAFGLDSVFSPLPFRASIALLLDRSMMLFEIAFAVSCALLIRGRFDSLAGKFCVVGALVVLFILTLVCLIKRIDFAHLPPAGLLYAAIMAAATYLNVRLANRFWTIQHLVRGARAKT